MTWNYRIVKNQKSNLIHFQFNKNTTHTHNKASIIFKNIKRGMIITIKGLSNNHGKHIVI